MKQTPFLKWLQVLVFVGLAGRVAYVEVASWYMNRLYADGPVVVCAPYGGTGNQLFRYAAAYALAKPHNAKVLIQRTQWWNGASFGAHNRELALSHFGVDTTSLLPKVLIKFVKNENYVEVNETNFQDILARGLEKKFYYLTGCYESARFYQTQRNAIKALFQLKAQGSDVLAKFEEAIHRSESVFVHIRKGDVTGLPMDYFKSQMQQAKTHMTNPTFFIFTDSPEKVTQDLKNNPDVVMVSGNGLSSLQELHLMSQCQSGILSMGTFSYWAVELGVNKAHVYAPGPSAMYPGDWAIHPPL
jgi:hypothetical protein